MANPITRAIGAIAKSVLDKPKTNPLVKPQRNLGDVKGIAGDLPVENLTPFEERKRILFPMVYADPNRLLEKVQVAPESENLGRLFNTSREELAENAMNRRSADPNWAPPGTKAKPRGSAAAQRIMIPENAERLLEMLIAAQRQRPDMNQGMTGWMSQEPLLRQMRQIMDEDEAVRRFKAQNAFSSMSSPGSDVETEIIRGSAADYMNEQGKLGEWIEFGGAPNKIRMEPGWNQGRKYWGMEPEMGEQLRGHPYHSTAQGQAMQRYADTGGFGKEPKVPIYNASSTPEEIGGQTHMATPDAHFTRGVGMPDVRGGKTQLGRSMTMPEAQTFLPWYEKNVAQEMGYTSNIAQPIHWAAYGPATGVKTAIGAPILEMKADAIVKAAKRLGISPEEARDIWMKSGLPLGQADPEMLAYIAAAMGGGLAGGTLAKGHFQNEANPITGR